jgi:hypothetical protein
MPGTFFEKTQSGKAGARYDGGKWGVNEQLNDWHMGAFFAIYAGSAPADRHHQVSLHRPFQSYESQVKNSFHSAHQIETLYI